jgi:hypothetical protein
MHASQSRCRCKRLNHTGHLALELEVIELLRRVEIPNCAIVRVVHVIRARSERAHRCDKLQVWTKRLSRRTHAV